MAARTWIGGPGDWNTVAEWSPQGVPGLGDDAVLGAGVIITRGEIVTARSVSLDDPTASLTVDGSLQNATVRSQGGQLSGLGALYNATVVGTVTTNALTIGGTVTPVGTNLELRHGRRDRHQRGALSRQSDRRERHLHGGCESHPDHG